MSDATYSGVNEGKTEADINARVEELVPSPSCGTSECTNDHVTEAERAWVKLMSAVPTVNQHEGMRAQRTDVALPPDETVKSLVLSLRPDSPDAYSFEEIATQWLVFKGLIEEIKANVKSATIDVGNDWTGTDYNNMTEQVDIVIGNIDAMVDAIGGEGEGGAVGQLREKQDTVYEQQGGNAVAYPAPLFFMEDRPACANQLHIRVPFTDTCDIAVDDEAEAALAKAGFEPTVFSEVREERNEEYNNKLAEYQANPDTVPPGMTPEQAATKDADDYADERAKEKGAEGSSEYQAKAAEVDGDVLTRTENVEFQVAAIEPTAEPANDTAFNDGTTPTWPGLDGGTSPQTPQGTGSGSYSSPDNLTPVGSSGLNGGGSGAGTVDTSTGLDSDNPWASGVGDDPDDLSGGLASGGAGTLTAPGTGAGTGLGAGGLGGGAGACAGAGGGLFGATGGMGAGAGGRGAGAGGMGRGGGMAGAKGVGATAAGRGGASSMMGGGRGAQGNLGEDEEGRDTWLTEDDDIWGLARFDDDNDPLA